MNNLIVYATKYGCTEKCAGILAQKLEGKTDVQNLKDSKALDLSQYDSVVIGGSQYIGRIQKEVTEFCTKNMDILKTKKIGLFICGMQSEEVLQTELSTSFPKELLEHAAAKECFGGEFIFKKMNFMDRTIAKMVAKTDKDKSSISEESISGFAKLMNTGD
ncbi:MAG: flavodoxin domain-containing protein [Lutisporaceae bacterium]